MGANAPKSEELLAELEDEIKDAIISEHTDDRILGQTLMIVINAIQTDRHLYANPLDEPYFYQQYLRRWVEEGFEELAKISKIQNKSGEKG